MECTSVPLKILYGIQGEGRGHASRSLHIINHLSKQGHTIHVFAGGDALPLLSNQSIAITRVPMFRLHYNKKGNLSVFQTLIKNFNRFIDLFVIHNKRFRAIENKIKKFNPDFVISDFEPFTSQIAMKLGIPVLMIDHQHFFIESKIPYFSEIGKNLVLLSYRLFIRLFSGMPQQVIVSSFHHFPARKKSKASFVGPFITNILYSKKVSQKNHFTVYLKEPKYVKFLFPVLKKATHINFQIFSNWTKNDIEFSKYNHIKLCSIDQKKFLSSLASSTALITTAGNQVIGEAIFLQKPILAFPKSGDIEQEINAKSLKMSGFGEIFHIREFPEDLLQSFMSRIPQIKQHFEKTNKIRQNYDGTSETLTMIDDFIHEFVLKRKTTEIYLGKFKISFNQLNFKLSFNLIR